MRQHCKTCQAPIVWGVNVESGKGIPMNPQPVPNGDLMRVYDYADSNKAQIPVRHIKDDAEPDEYTTRYQSHFNTCPDAEQWQARKQQRRQRR